MRGRLQQGGYVMVLLPSIYCGADALRISYSSKKGHGPLVRQITDTCVPCYPCEPLDLSVNSVNAYQQIISA
jgi:hypothetical protein